MSEAKTLALKAPVKFGSETITELVFRKPKAKDFRAFPAGNPTMGDVLDLMGRLCNQPPSVIDELETEDLAEASGIVAGFIPGGLATGAKR